MRPRTSRGLKKKKPHPTSLSFSFLLISHLEVLVFLCLFDHIQHSVNSQHEFFKKISLCELTVKTPQDISPEFLTPFAAAFSTAVQTKIILLLTMSLCGQKTQNDIPFPLCFAVKVFRFIGTSFEKYICGLTDSIQASLVTATVSMCCFPEASSHLSPTWTAAPVWYSTDLIDGPVIHCHLITSIGSLVSIFLLALLYPFSDSSIFDSVVLEMCPGFYLFTSCSCHLSVCLHFSKSWHYCCQSSSVRIAILNPVGQCWHAVFWLFVWPLRYIVLMVSVSIQPCLFSMAMLMCDTTCTL